MADPRRIGAPDNPGHSEAPRNRWGGLWHVTTSGDRHWLSKDVCFECTATPDQRKAADAQWGGMRPASTSGGSDPST